MKIMIASDLHGSAYYTDKMLELYMRETPDRLILLGDLLYHGPRNQLPKGYDPARTAELLNSVRHKVLCVRGNCDSEVDQMMLEFPIGADYAIWLEGDSLIFMTHGHLYNEQNPPAIGRRDVLLHGHTHIPCAKDLGNMYFLNPGSVSIPKGGSPNSLAIYENDVFRILDLNGNEVDALTIAPA